MKWLDFGILAGLVFIGLVALAKTGEALKARKLRKEKEECLKSSKKRS